jgi:hypothetical protein
MGLHNRVCYSISCIVWRGDDIVNCDADVLKYTAEMVFMERRYFNFASRVELECSYFCVASNEALLIANNEQ